MMRGPFVRRSSGALCWHFQVFLFVGLHSWHEHHHHDHQDLHPANNVILSILDQRSRFHCSTQHFATTKAPRLARNELCSTNHLLNWRPLRQGRVRHSTWWKAHLRRLLVMELGCLFSDRRSCLHRHLGNGPPRFMMSAGKRTCVCSSSRTRNKLAACRPLGGRAKREHVAHNGRRRNFRRPTRDTTA